MKFQKKISKIRFYKENALKYSGEFQGKMQCVVFAAFYPVPDSRQKTSGFFAQHLTTEKNEPCPLPEYNSLRPESALCAQNHGCCRAVA